MKAKYQIYQDVAGKFRFRLRAPNNKIIAVSEAYESKAACINGVKSVQANCGSHVEDQTTGMEKINNPKYEVFIDTAHEFRFNLKASNGEIIAASQGYETKQGAMQGIEAVQNSCDAEIEDLTVDQQTKDRQLAEAVMKSCNANVTTESITYMPYEPKEVCKEPAPGLNDTFITLDAPPTKVESGTKVTLTGKLNMAGSCEGIDCVTIHIFEHDRSFLRDDFLASGETNPDGTFSIDWIAKQKDFWDDKVQVYARFIGTDNYMPATSKIYPIQVLWYARPKN
ncbi:MAG: YegP family protein [Candidatus Bathyarchaeota archaeon]|nr:YegP family protein [Candidatus Bathyarchaeum tardum]